MKILSKAMLIIAPILVLFASFPAQSKDIEIPNPYPKPKAILEQIFLNEGETLNQEALRYAQYADFSLGCYNFYSFDAKIVRAQVKTSEKIIKQLEELKKLSLEEFKKREGIYNSSKEKMNKFISDYKLAKSIQKSLIPHLQLGVRKLAEKSPSSVIKSVADKKYAEVFSHHKSFKSAGKYPVCPVKIDKPLLTDRSIPYA